MRVGQRALGIIGEPTKSSHPVDVGQRSEAAVLAAFVKHGYRVLTPFGVNHRYDFALDTGDRFLRVQCKTGRLKNGAVCFAALSTRVNTQSTYRRTYAGRSIEADTLGEGLRAARLAQLAEHPPCKGKILGSSPGAGSDP